MWVASQLRIAAGPKNWKSDRKDLSISQPVELKKNPVLRSCNSLFSQSRKGFANFIFGPYKLAAFKVMWVHKIQHESAQKPTLPYS